MPLPDGYLIRNRLLRLLPPDELDPLRRYLDVVQVRKKEVVIAPGEPFEHAWFPEGGLASVVSGADGGGGRRWAPSATRP